MNLFHIFNLVEGVWWIGLGIWVWWCGVIRRRLHKTILSVILLLFGISDFVEMSTGAWWEPAWLLVWKAACVACVIIFIILIVLERRVK